MLRDVIFTCLMFLLIKSSHSKPQETDSSRIFMAKNFSSVPEFGCTLFQLQMSTPSHQHLNFTSTQSQQVQDVTTSYNNELLNKIFRFVEDQGNQIKDLAQKFEITSSKVDDLKTKESNLLSVLNGQQTQLSNQLDKFEEKMKQIQVENHRTMLTKFSEATKLACELSRKDLPTTNINGKRYFMSLYQPPMTWGEAENFCKSHNTDLVSIESKQEWEALIPYVNQLITKHRAFVWSAATDTEQEGNWKWSSTGDEVTFCPGNSINNHDDEDCMHMWENGWSDYPCSGKQAFICEVNAMC